MPFFKKSKPSDITLRSSFSGNIFGGLTHILSWYMLDILDIVFWALLFKLSHRENEDCTLITHSCIQHCYWNSFEYWWISQTSNTDTDFFDAVSMNRTFWWKLYLLLFQVGWSALEHVCNRNVFIITCMYWIQHTKKFVIPKCEIKETTFKTDCSLEVTKH